MNTKPIYTMVKVSSDAEDALRIHLRWPALMEASAFSAVGRKRGFYMSCPVEPVKGCELLMLPAGFLLQSLNASHEWTMPSIFGATADLLCLQMHARMVVSDRSVLYNPQPGKRSTLVVPSLIVSVGSIATIRRILEVRSFVWSLYFDGDWQRMRRAHYSTHPTNRSLWHSLGTPTAGTIQNGSRAKKQTSE